MLSLQKLAPYLTRNIIFKYYSSSSAVVQTLKEKTEKVEKPAQQIYKPKNPIIAAAFESLKDESSPDPFIIDNTDRRLDPKNSIDERIINAKSVNGLLTISEVSGPISRIHALKIVSILSDWSSINKAKLSDFENDPRFIKLCRILGRSVPKTNGNGNGTKKITGFRTDDLNTVLGVTGDDEAAKLIASISLPQMVKVMSTLAQKKRRSTPLLRSLAYNISSNPTILDLKQCGDLLYAMAVLNFPDSILVARVCSDIHTGLEKVDKSAVIGSILTSIGIIKYRDLDVLEALTGWIINHQDICRPQDISSLFLTLATLNYSTTKSSILKEKLVASLTKPDLKRTIDWLDHVWALTVLGLSQSQQIESVLVKEYLDELNTEMGVKSLSPTTKMKLLNINAAAKLLVPNYKGKLLPEGDLYEIPLVHNKGKQTLVAGMMDALKSLISTTSLIQTNVDTKMGFVIDACCLFDEKGSPVAHDKATADTTRIAVMVQDYHDLCQGNHQLPTGITALAIQLLEKSGYKVLTIPYNEFNTSDKLLKRVQYLEAKLKNCLKK